MRLFLVVIVVGILFIVVVTTIPPGAFAILEHDHCKSDASESDNGRCPSEAKASHEVFRRSPTALGTRVRDRQAAVTSRSDAYSEAQQQLPMRPALSCYWEGESFLKLQTQRLQTLGITTDAVIATCHTQD